MPSKSYSKTKAATKSKQWYKENKEKKISYEKARKEEHLARYYARKKMNSNGKGIDIHHKDGNPKNNSKNNLKKVKKDHSKRK